MIDPKWTQKLDTLLQRLSWTGVGIYKSLIAFDNWREADLVAHFLNYMECMSSDLH